MATTEIVNIYRSLANKPTTGRQMEYVIERIETELEKRVKNAISKLLR